jgi:hypothetical protein
MADRRNRRDDQIRMRKYEGDTDSPYAVATSAFKTPLIFAAFCLLALLAGFAGGRVSNSGKLEHPGLAPISSRRNYSPHKKPTRN